MTGGNPTQGTVTLTGNAPAGGTVVQLASYLPNVAAVPTSITVPAGQATAGFPVTTNPVDVNKLVTLRATVGSVIKTTALGVNAPFISSISVSPTTVQGGHKTVDLTINLSGVAPANGWKVLLSSSAPAILHLPTSTLVLSNKSSHTVKHLYTTVVTSPVNILITATRAGVTRTTTLTVTP